MDEMKLELKLGPPGDDADKYSSTNPSVSLGYSCAGAKRGFYSTIENKNEGKQQCPPSSHASKNAADAVQNISKTRITSTPVVGWPPIRSFRRSLASSSSKPVLNDSKEGSLEKATKLETSSKGLFVKINMDGIPIGRKVDLKAYDSYEKLSVAVDELFRGLLAAQSDPRTTGNKGHLQKLDGSGEYTLVYEDEEGDQMLAGDVPWEMFVSTAKRLRVLRSSELSTLHLGTINKKITT